MLKEFFRIVLKTLPDWDIHQEIAECVGNFKTVAFLNHVTHSNNFEGVL